MSSLDYVNEKGCQLLAVAIIEWAVRDWEREIVETKRDELAAFFRSSWCEFLFTSITDMPVESMWKELGVPEAGHAGHEV